MFDVSFAEVLVIGVVALLVIGPEKLPKVARTVGAFAGRMQRYVAQVKEEINREVRFEELQSLQLEIKQSVEQQVVAVKASFDEALDVKPLENDLPAGKKSIKPTAKRIVKPSARITKNQDLVDKSVLIKQNHVPNEIIQAPLEIPPRITKAAKNTNSDHQQISEDALNSKPKKPKKVLDQPLLKKAQ